MNKPKLTYYNYFLILSLVLIAGYMITSLFFLYRTDNSGEQAADFGRTVKRTNAVIQQTYHLESLAHGYLLTSCDDTYDEYILQKTDLLKGYDTLKKHCEVNNMAVAHAQKLHGLVQKRIDILDDLIHQDSLHNMPNETRISHMNLGSSITDSIINTLKEIRQVSSGLRIENQVLASDYNRNAMFLLSVFGVVMLVIVLISFLKMKKALLENAKNVHEINQINLELKSMNENLENFAYVASHDLNEPLRKIRTFGDLVRSEFDQAEPDSKVIVSHIERMQNASLRMQELIEDLLSYSRISRDFNAMDAVDLNTIVDNVLYDLEITIKEHNAQIDVGDLPKNIKVDAIQMRQLFQNLISNALKFKKEGEIPSIKVSSEKINVDKVPHKEAKSLLAKEYWKIDVKDNGIGFEPKYVDRIFAVFQRLHGRSSYKGTGIGLSICKKICENHKGFITAISQPGEGATFSIYLPITPEV